MKSDLDYHHDTLIQASRRKFLKQGALGAALGLGLAGTPLRATAATGSRGGLGKGRPRNLILLVSDGMSHGTLAMADQYLTVQSGKRSHWMKLYENHSVARALMEMASQNSIIPDSAAASSSWGCGVRVPNGRINVDVDGVEHQPVLQIAREQGLSAGLVTTATVTHATPAGFAANGESRNSEELFANQYLDRGYEVILGGGKRIMMQDLREDGRDMLGAFAADGYEVVYDRSGLAAAKGSGKILGLFSDGHLPYEVDRLHQPGLEAAVPSLAEMTRAALEILSANENGFIVQVEAARVDHAAHNNDPAGLVFDQIALDEALGVAMDFYREHPDTLVIVTSDHGNANPGLLSGVGLGEQTLGRLANYRSSFGPLLEGHESWPDLGVEAVRERIYAQTMTEISEREAQLLIDRIAGDWEAPFNAFSGLNRVPSVLGQILANSLHIGWAGRTHTSDFVELVAVGPGSGMVRPWVRNTDLFTIMTESLGISRG